MQGEEFVADNVPEAAIAVAWISEHKSWVNGEESGPSTTTPSKSCTTTELNASVSRGSTALSKAKSSATERNRPPQH
jgi:hypothetical protein